MSNLSEEYDADDSVLDIDPVAVGGPPPTQDKPQDGAQ
jgi:hypothetical protein